MRDISCIKRLSSVVGSAKIDVHPSMLDNLVHDTRLQLSLALRLLYSFFFSAHTLSALRTPYRKGRSVAIVSRSTRSKHGLVSHIEGDGHPTIDADLETFSTMLLGQSVFLTTALLFATKTGR